MDTLKVVRALANVVYVLLQCRVQVGKCVLECVCVYMCGCVSGFLPVWQAGGLFFW